MTDIPFSPDSENEDLEPDHPALVDPQGWHWIRGEGNIPHSEFVQPVAWREHHTLNAWRPHFKHQWWQEAMRDGVPEWDDRDNPLADRDEPEA